MSFKARRLTDPSQFEPFDWGRAGQDAQPRVVEALFLEDGAAGTPPAGPPAPTIDLAQQQARLAAMEREAFAKGYEQGERAGSEAGAKRAEAMLRRLAQTIEELADVRRSMVRQTERQMVQLALAIARRIVRREVTLDSDLTVTMARVALDRLGDSTSVTIRLNPDDFEATSGRRDTLLAGSHVTVVPDPSVSRGGCLVQSDFGYVDASVDAQFQELARALLVEEGQDQPVMNRGR
ncbi:MAG TPA: FliH/SctL family protein [Vicinamibacterales bacterium]|jgi:flagellar assembly protein FliH